MALHNASTNYYTCTGQWRKTKKGICTDGKVSLIVRWSDAVLVCAMNIVVNPPRTLWLSGAGRWSPAPLHRAAGLPDFQVPSTGLLAAASRWHGATGAKQNARRTSYVQPASQPSRGLHRSQLSTPGACFCLEQLVRTNADLVTLSQIKRMTRMIISFKYEQIEI